MKKSIITIVFLFFTGFAFSQTTVTLQDQCNCEVLSGTVVTTPGVATPAGADAGDIYINTNTGTIYFWDGDSWELTATDDQQLTGFTFDGATNELTLTLENGGSVNVDLSSLSDTLADTNTTITSFDIDGTNTNLVITDSDTNTFSVALADIAALVDTDDQTLTDVLTEGADAGGTVITNVGTPVAAGDAVTKAYVDGLADDDISAVTFDGTDLSVTESGTTLSADISALDDSAGVTANAGNIATNTTNIATNAGNITTNATNIATNTGNITTNATDIANHIAADDDTDDTNEIQDLTDVLTEGADAGGTVITNVGTPVAAGDAVTKAYVDGLADDDISAVTFDGTDLSVTESGTTLSADISALDDSAGVTANAGNIATNTTNIATNAGNITTNATNIATNTGNITTNATDIANHIAADDDTDDTNEIQDLADVLTEGADAGGTVITNVGTPVAAGDAVTKAYVDGLADDDISAVTFDGTDLSVTESGTTLSADISALDDSAGVTANAGNIATNTTNIATNAGDITTNAGNITTNATNIATNTGNITTNATDIANHIAADDDTDDTNEIQDLTDVLTEGADAGGTVITNVGTPVAAGDAVTKAYVDGLADDDISAVTFDGTDLSVTESGTTLSADISALDDSAGVTANAGNIATNTTNIATNAGDITTNAGNITTNATNIATNTGNITTNATDIANHIAADDDTDDTNEIQDLTDVLTEGADAGGTVITNVGTPVAAGDAVTKAYVDGLADDDISAVTFDGTDLSVTESGTTLSADISALDDSAGVTANAGNIATNTTNIATNTGNITTNATDIANHIAADDDTDDTNEIQDAGGVDYDPSTTTLTSDNVQEVIEELKAEVDAFAATSGQTNTASNSGTGGVGVWARKAGADLEFKNINAGSSRITITDDTGNDEVDIDINDTALDATFATDAELAAAADDDISAVTFDGTDLSVTESGTTLSADISALDDSAGVTANAGNIATNTTNIATNTGDITTNAGNITTNATNIATNTGNITTNATDIANHIAADDDTDDTNEIQDLTDVLTEGADAGGTVITNVGTPVAAGDAVTKAYVDGLADDDISAVTFDGTDLSVTESGTTLSADISALDDSAGVTANAGNIATNTTNIATNAGDITTNTGNITTNATNIATNTGNITTNATDIANHIAADDDTDDTNEIQDLTDVLTEGADAGGTVITNVGTPVAAGDAVTKAYVDGLADDDISAVTFDGIDLSVTESGTTLSADISALDDSAGVTANAGNIATNTTNIATNAGDITTNAGNITTNAMNIATNTGNITTNATDIANHIAADDDTDDTNEIQDAAGVDFTATGNTTSTNVQDAIEEIQTELDGVDGTDDQNLENFQVNGVNLEISIQDGNTVSVPLADIDTDNQTASEVTVADAGGNFTNNEVEGVLEEIDTRIDALVLAGGSDGNDFVTGGSLSGTDLTLNVPNQIDPVIDLSGLQDGTGTDDQGLGIGVGGVANESVEVTITDGASTTIDIRDADSNETNEIQDLADVLTEGADAGGTVITNVGTPVAAGDAVTKAYVDGLADDDISAVTFDGTDLSVTESGTTLSADISALDDSAGVTANAGNIATNTTNIATNTGDITTNAGNITTNATNIATNTGNITTNATDIANHIAADDDTDDTNEIQDLTDVLTEGADAGGTVITNVGTPVAAGDAVTKAYVDGLADDDISAVTFDGTDLSVTESGTTLSADISALDDSAGVTANAGNITTNAGNITTNAGNITTNATNIATNTGNITTNATDIANHIAADDDTDDTNEIQDLTDVLTEGADAGGTVITNVGTPVAAGDAVTKAYVDGLADDDISAVTFDGTDLSVTESGTTLSADISALDDSAGVTANAGNIATNTTNIATNAGNITTNATNIATNTGNITTNATDIANHIAADDDTDDTNEIQDLTDVLTEGADAGGTVITNVGTPVAAGDAVTKAYVDGLADDDISAVTFDGTDLSVTESGTTLSADISALDDSAGVTANAGNIATNTTNIATNAGDITTNATNIATNTGNITTNATDIANHIAADDDTDDTNEIQDLTDVLTEGADAGGTVITNVGTPVAAGDAVTKAYVDGLADDDISAVTFDGTDLSVTESGTTLSADISALDDSAGVTANAGNIATNTTNIATNAGNITTNATNIATNTGNITTNATDIANHIAADDDTDDTNEIQDLTDVLTEGADAGGTVITNVGTPVAAGDAVTKAYVDGLADDDISAVTFDGTDLSVTESGTTLSADISALDDSAGVTANAGNIATNTTNIATNAGDITTNAGNITTNATNIATNTGNITTNATDIANHIAADDDTDDTNEIQDLADVLTEGADAGGTVITNVGTPVAAGDAVTKAYVDGLADDDISAVTFDGTDLSVTESGTTLSADISALDDSAGVTANAGNITTNATNIATNTGNITTNATDIANHIAADDDTDDTNEIQDLADVLTEGADAGGTVITNVGTPVAAGDAVTKAYVDGLADDDISAVTFDGTDLSVTESGTTLSADISALDDSAGVTANAGNIATNTTNIATNAGDITTNAGNITTNATNIATNTGNITTNATDIANHIAADDDTDDTNEIQDLTDVLTEGADAGGTVITNVGTPVAAGDAVTKAYVDGLADDDISAVTFDGTDLSVTESGTTLSADISALDDSAGVTANAGNIATNTTNIATNAGDITTNAGNITTNATNIATNTGNITTNATDIANHIAADDDTDDMNEIELPTGGTSGQLLSTNGSGVYSWVDDANDDDQTAGEVNLDTPIDIDGDTVDDYTTVEDVLQDVAPVIPAIKAARVFYPPSIAIDASTTGTQVIDLYAQYIAQYGTPMVRSDDGGPDEAPAAIPTYAADELYYYITYADAAVFDTTSTSGPTEMTITADGELTITVIAPPADYNSLINVVFVVK